MPYRLIKIKSILGSIKYFVYGVFVYLDLDIDIFKILMLFMCLDSLSGIAKVISVDYKSLSMKLLIKGIVSKIAFLILPLSVALLGKGVGQELGFGAELVMKLLIVSEFLSLIGNLYTAKTKIQVQEVDIFTMIYKSIRVGGMGFITNSLKKIESAGGCEENVEEEKKE